jgi:hypothetical protein
VNTVPDKIGGAKVIYYSPIDERHHFTGNTTHIASGKMVDMVHGLAICKYEEEDGFYLFGCDEDWRSITDTFHDTIEDAKNQAEFEYKNIHHTWIKRDKK